MADPRNPSDADVINAAIEAAESRRQRSFPGIVSSYDPDTLRAVVQPALRIRAKSGQQITPKPVTIPVAWPSWGEIVIQGKLQPGDEVTVECVDRNWLVWLEQGGVVDYNAIGGSQAGYAVAHPLQLSSQSRPGALAAGDAVKIGKRDGTSTVILRDDGSVFIQSGTVRLGSAAPTPALAVARDTDNVNRSAAFETWQQAVSAGAMVAPLPPGPIGDIAASSTEVSST